MNLYRNHVTVIVNMSKVSKENLYDDSVVKTRKVFQLFSCHNNAMFSSSSKHAVHYRIQSQTDVVRLTVWEATSSTANSHPYRYILNYSFKRLDDAYHALRHHLFVNGVATATELELPDRGCVHVLPYSTWSDADVNAGVRVEAYSASWAMEKVS